LNTVDAELMPIQLAELTQGLEHPLRSFGQVLIADYTKLVHGVGHLFLDSQVYFEPVVDPQVGAASRKEPLVSVQRGCCSGAGQPLKQPEARVLFLWPIRR